jgi:hypothetical protein
VRRAALSAAAAAALVVLPAVTSQPVLAAGGEGGCILAPGDLGPAVAPQRLRFGITPGIAGSAGGSQGSARPVDQGQTTRALERMALPRRTLVIHLNRLFSSDGSAGIRAFARQVDRYARQGFESEVQVRYHPGSSQEGDIPAFVHFVHHAVERLGRRKSVVAFTITNEANFPISGNTSDGSYRGVVSALTAGVVEADRTLRRIGRQRVDVGFTVAWRYLPNADLGFWQKVGQAGGRPFRRALDFVGAQVYPGLVWPPVSIPGRSAGVEMTDALALLRRCYMPIAGLGDRVDLWVTENGYATNLGHSETRQASELGSTLDAVHAVSGTLGVTDYRYFNLRDNDSDGTDLFAAVGLLRDDYSGKPAFEVMTRGIRSMGR